MDANGTRFHRLYGAADWTAMDAHVGWEEAHRSLRLRSQRPEEPLKEDAERARIAREACPGAVDRAGAYAMVEGEVLRVHHPDLLDRELLSGVKGATAVAMGPDGIIAVAAEGKLYLRDSHTLGDPREDWHLLDTAALPSFEAWRIAASPEGGAWVLDRAHRVLWRWTGSLLRNRPKVLAAPGVFKLSPEDPQTWRMLPVLSGFAGEELLGLACAPDGRVAVLGRLPGQPVKVHLLDSEGVWLRDATIHGQRHPISASWVGDRLALLCTDGDATIVMAFEANTDAVWFPVGEYYPLRSHTGAAFLVSTDGLCRYPSEDGPRELVALSLPSRPDKGLAEGRPLDSGRSDTCWHRLYLEARVPPGCGFRFWLASSADGNAPVDPDQWFPHELGLLPPVEDVPGTDEVPTLSGAVPQLVWQQDASEIPGDAGLVSERRPNQAGLFSVLVQRRGMKATRLIGRYLHIRVEFRADGRATPEIFSIRAWGSRFSYVRRYLPELFHEHPAMDGSSIPGPASGADFFDRYVALFESVLTPLEDKVAEAWILSNPRTTPAESLDWLAAWLGRSLDPAVSEKARRRLIAAAPQLAQWRGTKRGLELALEIVTEGGVTKGEVVVLEEWRLRRTWATILGADLADEQDPLLQGLVVSGNSIVGDTLILGDEHHREFMALFGDATLSPADRAAVQAFYRRTAWRATVLVVDATDPQTLGLVRRMVAAEAPAHLRIEVKSATRSFVTGVSALIGIDTHLGVEPPLRTVRLGQSRIGTGDRLRRPAGLHPDLEGEGG